MRTFSQRGEVRLQLAFMYEKLAKRARAQARLQQIFSAATGFGGFWGLG